MEEHGLEAVHGVERLEKEGKVTVHPYSLREAVRPLLTREARALLVAAMQKTPNVKELKKKALEIEKAMWVPWHWRKGNEFIPDAVGMSSPCPRRCSCRACLLPCLRRASRRQAGVPNLTG